MSKVISSSCRSYEIVENDDQRRNHPASRYVTVAVLLHGNESFFITDVKIRNRVLFKRIHILQGLKREDVLREFGNGC